MVGERYLQYVQFTGCSCLEELVDGGEIPRNWIFGEFSLLQNVLQYSPDLLFGLYLQILEIFGQLFDLLSLKLLKNSQIIKSLLHKGRLVERRNPERAIEVPG